MSARNRAVANLVSAIVHETVSCYRCYGEYVLVIQGNPRIPKPSSREGRCLVNDATLYIGVTGSIEAQKPERLYEDNTGAIFIEKRTRHASGKVLVEYVSDSKQSPATTLDSQ